MKRLNVVFLILALITFSACNEQTEVTPDEFEFVSVKIPDAYTATSSNGRLDSETEEVILDIKVIAEDGTEVIGQARFVMPIDEESLVSFELTANIFENTELTPDFWSNGNDSASGRVGAMLGCFSTCNENHDKGDGRGKCKAECWLDIAVLVGIVVVIITF